MYHVLNNCAGAGGNGNGLNTNRKLIYEFVLPPAPRSHANTYRFSLFSTPLLSRRTRPLSDPTGARHNILKKERRPNNSVHRSCSFKRIQILNVEPTKKGKILIRRWWHNQEQKECPASQSNTRSLEPIH